MEPLSTISMSLLAARTLRITPPSSSHSSDDNFSTGDDYDATPEIAGAGTDIIAFAPSSGSEEWDDINQSELELLPCGLPDVSSKCYFRCYTCLEKFKNAHVLWLHLCEQHLYFQADYQRKQSYDRNVISARTSLDEDSDESDGYSDDGHDMEVVSAECDENYDEHVYGDETVFDEFAASYELAQQQHVAATTIQSSHTSENDNVCEGDRMVGEYTSTGSSALSDDDSYIDVAVQVNENELVMEEADATANAAAAAAAVAEVDLAFEAVNSMLIAGCYMQQEYQQAYVGGHYLYISPQQQLAQQYQLLADMAMFALMPSGIMAYYEQAHYVQRWMAFYYGEPRFIQRGPTLFEEPRLIEGIPAYYEEAFYLQQIPVALTEQAPRIGAIAWWTAANTNITQQHF